MLSRKQDELFSHAARLALRGNHAAKDGDKPSSLQPLLASWGEIEIIPRLASAPARKVANSILASANARKPMIAKGPVENDFMRTFGLECVLLFRIGRGDDPRNHPLEFGDYS
jgi:hypothetical protein